LQIISFCAIIIVIYKKKGFLIMQKENLEITKYSYTKNKDEYSIYIIPNSKEIETVEFYIQKNKQGTIYRIGESNLKSRDDIEQTIEEIIAENIENAYNSVAGCTYSI